MKAGNISRKAVLCLFFGLMAILLSFDVSSVAEDDITAIVPDQIVWRMDDAIAERKEVFSCELTNNSALPFKVLGMSMVCCDRGCVTAIDPPDLIPAHGSTTFRFVFDPKGVGPFELGSKIFLGTGGPKGIVVPIKLIGNVF